MRPVPKLFISLILLLPLAQNARAQAAREGIDTCLVGTWEQTGGGPTEWMVRMGIPVSRENMGNLRLTFRNDGTFTSDMMRVDMDTTVPDHHTEYRGRISRSVGRWTAQDGVINARYLGGGEGTVTATDSSTSGSYSVAQSYPGYAGITGSTHYACSGDSLTSEIATPRGGPIRYEFRRLSSSASR